MMFRIPTFSTAVPASILQGFIPEEPKVEDHSFTGSPIDLPSGSGAIDNSKYYLPVSAQLHLPSCTANAVVDLWEAFLVRQQVQQGKGLQAALKDTPQLSRLFCWYFARMWMDPPQHNNPNSGCFNRHNMEVIARFGLPKESIWPYEPHLACVRPSITAQREAFARRSKAFYSIDESPSKRHVPIRRALTISPGVAFGTGIGREFLSYRSGVLSRPSSIIGYHAMVIVGVDTQGNYLVRNSWGDRWGDGGYCSMSPDYIAWEKTSGLWVPWSD